MADDAFVGYNNWAAEKLAITLYQNFVYENNDPIDRGVFVAEDVPAHSVLVSIPFESLLSIQSFKSHETLAPLLQNYNHDTDEEHLLVCLLLFERYYQRKLSKWSTHFEILPNNFPNNFLALTEADLDCLKDTSLQDIAIQFQKQVQLNYKIIQEQFFPRVFQLLQPEQQATFDSFFNQANYEWALSIIYSRFVTVQGTSDQWETEGSQLFKTMAPVFDMFNHSPMASTQHYFNEENNCFELLTDDYIAAGQQVFINYGPLANSKLFLFYGFLLDNEDNPHNTIDIYVTIDVGSSEWTSDMKDLLNVQLEILNEYCIIDQYVTTEDESEITLAFPVNQHELHEELLFCLRLQHMINGDYTLDQIKSLQPEETLENNDEYEVISALLYGLQQMLNHYEIEDTEEKLARKNREESVKINEMIYAFKKYEYEVLQQHIDLIKEHLLYLIRFNKK